MATDVTGAVVEQSGQVVAEAAAGADAGAVGLVLFTAALAVEVFVDFGAVGADRFAGVGQAR